MNHVRVKHPDMYNRICSILIELHQNHVKDMQEKVEYVEPKIEKIDAVGPVEITHVLNDTGAWERNEQMFIASVATTLRRWQNEQHFKDNRLQAFLESYFKYKMDGLEDVPVILKCTREEYSNLVSGHEHQIEMIRKRISRNKERVKRLESGGFKCDSCERIYKSQGALTNHIKQKHPRAYYDRLEYLIQRDFDDPDDYRFTNRLINERKVQYGLSIQEEPAFLDPFIYKWLAYNVLQRAEMGREIIEDWMDEKYEKEAVEHEKNSFITELSWAKDSLLQYYSHNLKKDDFPPLVLKSLIKNIERITQVITSIPLEVMVQPREEMVNYLEKKLLEIETGK